MLTLFNSVFQTKAVTIQSHYTSIEYTACKQYINGYDKNPWTFKKLQGQFLFHVLLCNTDSNVNQKERLQIFKRLTRVWLNEHTRLCIANKTVSKQ